VNDLRLEYYGIIVVSSLNAAFFGRSLQRRGTAAGGGLVATNRNKKQKNDRTNGDRQRKTLPLLSIGIAVIVVIVVATFTLEATCRSLSLAEAVVGMVMMVLLLDLLSSSLSPAFLFFDFVAQQVSPCSRRVVALLLTYHR
jgi:hypothetical protein